MSSPLNGFNRIASVYDKLGWLVFGDALHQAQTLFLNRIAPGSTVLILGGGTGRILTALFDTGFTGKVYYIEASSQMLLMSKARVKVTDDIVFIHGTQDDIPRHVKFAVVITNFFLDLFPSSELPGVINKIKQNMTPGALWLAADFIEGGKWWHRPLLRIMYTFFRITSGVAGRRLPRWREALGEADWIALESRSAFGGFMYSAVFKLSPVVKAH